MPILKKWPDENNLEIEEYTDPEPWEFKKIEKLLNSTILEGIKSDSEKKDVYLDMIEFTILQRFFRAAFEGAMSQSFPMEELEHLHKETFEFVNDNAPTLRWNARRLSLEGVLERRLLEINNPEPKIKQYHAYIKILSEAKNHAQASSYNSWDDTCSGSALLGEVSDEVASMADQVADILNLRRELNVGIDDFLAEDYQRNGCPKP